MGVIILISLIITLLIFLKPIISFFKNLNYKLLFTNFNITNIIGRSYYFIGFVLILLVDLIVLIEYNFQFTLTIFSFILVILTITNTIRFCKYLILSALANDYALHIADKTERSSVSSGVPRCGKTSSKNFTAVELAKKQWKSLQRDYWFCMNIKPENLPKRLLDSREEIIKAYEHAVKYIDNFIPCLYSFQTIYVGKRQSYELTKKMLLQQEPLPYKAVIMADEIGYIFPNKKRKSENDSVVDLDKLSDLCRFIGHYLDGYLLLTEQEFSKAFIDIRRVTGENIYFTQKQEWLMKPKLLTFIYELFFSFFDWYLWKMQHLKKGTRDYYVAVEESFNSSKRWFKFIKWLKHLKNQIGFRKYKFRTLTNSEVEGTSKQANKRGTFYLPAPLNCKYNDRVYKNMYEAKDMPLKAPVKQPFSPSEKELEERFKLLKKEKKC